MGSAAGAGAGGRAGTEAGRAGSSTAAGRVRSPSRAARTAWYTALNTARSLPNFTSVLAGWTFTSTALSFTSRWSTQAGKRPTIFWFW